MSTTINSVDPDQTAYLELEEAVGSLPAQAQAGVMLRALKGLPNNNVRKEIIVNTLQDMTPQEQAATIEAVRAGLEQPSVGVRDWLWVISITAFAVVLVGSFITLAISVFVAPSAGGTSGQVILTMFTSVVGFLAGLFVPSPVGNTKA